MTSTPGSDPPRRPRAVFGPVRPVCWPALGEEHAAEFLAELSDWVEWIQWRYTLDHRVIPHCWRHHGPHLEELSALYTAWQNAYNISTDGDAPIRWIEHFAAARQRLSDWTARTGCRPGAHRAGQITPGPPHAL
jgi:hypothetical protein